LSKSKIDLTVILPHEAKQTLPSSFRSANRSRSVSFQRVPEQEQELESLFLKQEQESKKVTWITFGKFIDQTLHVAERARIRSAHGNYLTPPM